MMEPIDKFTSGNKPGPPKQPKRLKPFVAIDLPPNPWALCKPENRDVILVTCGLMPGFIQRLTGNLTQGERDWILKQRRVHKYRDGRQLEIHTRTMRDTVQPIGGKIRLQNSRGVSVQIQDVKSFFQLNYPKLARRYGVDDLATIMERTRASLAEVGIKPASDQWWRTFGITDYVWRKLEIDLSKVPAVTAKKEPGNLQGYWAFGHTGEPVYSYDIRSAYLSVMAEFEALKPFADFIWKARQELVQANDPTAHLLKLAATVMPGKFTSEHPGNKYYRRPLGLYIRGVTNERLRQAMHLANSVSAPTMLNVHRYCVDGFIAHSDISKYLNIGDGLGQWKPVKKHNHLTIARTNVWFTDREYKDGGYHITEQQILDDPFEIHTSRTVFDWNRLEERNEPVILHQRHNDLTCRKCWDSVGELHDIF
jgi:hypothetical protein